MDRKETFKEVSDGKYGSVLALGSDIQYKILLANLALANEDGERNRLLRIELAIKLQRLSKAERKMVENEIQSDIDLTDKAIEEI